MILNKWAEAVLAERGDERGELGTGGEVTITSNNGISAYAEAGPAVKDFVDLVASKGIKGIEIERHWATGGEIERETGEKET